MGTSLACQRAELIGRPPLSQQRKSGMWQGQHPASLLPPLQHQRNCAWRTPLAFTIKGGQTSSSERAARTAPALGWSCSLRETLPSSLTGHLRGQRGQHGRGGSVPAGRPQGPLPGGGGEPAAASAQPTRGHCRLLGCRSCLCCRERRPCRAAPRPCRGLDGCQHRSGRFTDSSGHGPCLPHQSACRSPGVSVLCPALPTVPHPAVPALVGALLEVPTGLADLQAWSQGVPKGGR